MFVPFITIFSPLIWLLPFFVAKEQKHEERKREKMVRINERSCSFCGRDNCRSVTSARMRSRCCCASTTVSSSKGGESGPRGPLGGVRAEAANLCLEESLSRFSLVDVLSINEWKKENGAVHMCKSEKRRFVSFTYKKEGEFCGWKLVPWCPLARFH